MRRELGTARHRILLTNQSALGHGGEAAHKCQIGGAADAADGPKSGPARAKFKSGSSIRRQLDDEARLIVARECTQIDD